MNVVGLGGGIGAARFWDVLVPALGADRLTVVVNVADDLWTHGLLVCPDLDTTLYALSGQRDAERGWGVAGETWRCMDRLRGLGHDVWFNLGDRDLAVHLLRTGLLGQGFPLSAVTARLAAAMGVGVRVLPVTDDEVTTFVDTEDGEHLHYQEFLIRHAARPRVRRVHHAGLTAAAPAPGVLDALATADIVVLAPSHPVASMRPILDVRGVRAAIAASPAAVVAVTPIVSGVEIADPGEARRALSRQRLMAPLGYPATATGVASMYRGTADRFVLDAADEAERDAVAELGMEVVVVPTLVHLGASPDPLRAAVLSAGDAFRPARQSYPHEPFDAR